MLETMYTRKSVSYFLAFLLCSVTPQLAVAESNPASPGYGSNNSNSPSDSDGPESYTITASLIGAATTIYGLGTYGLYATTQHYRSKDDQDQAAEELALFMRKNHGSVTRDVLTARGLLWEQWRVESGLSQRELEKFERYFNGSSEQTEMLNLLNAKISVKEARLFATKMVQAVHNALGEERLVQSIEYALAHARRTHPQPS